MNEDPEEERMATFILRVPFFGRQRHEAGVARSVARAVHYGVNSRAQLFTTDVEKVPEGVIPTVCPRSFVEYDAILDDGNEPPDYKPNGQRV